MRNVSRVLLLLLLLLLVFSSVLTITIPVTAQGGSDFAEIEKPDSNIEVEVKEDVNFSAARHSGLIYIWNFGDGSPLEFGREVTHNYSEYGDYKVVLTCINPEGEMDNDTVKITVTGMFAQYPIYIQVFCSICMLAPIAIPIIILVIVAIVLKGQLEKKTERKWDFKALILAGVVLLCIPPYLLLSFFTFCTPCLTTGLNVVLGGLLWVGVGFVSIYLMKFMVWGMKKIPFGPFKNGLCIIRKPLPIESKFTDNTKKFSKKNFIEFALSMSLYPLFLTFFIMALFTETVADPADFFTLQNILIIMLAPLFTFMWVPIQIMLDSNLVFLRKEKQTGVLIMYMGASMRELVQGLVGVGAVVTFVSIFFVFGSGGEIMQIILGILIMFMIVPIVFPNIFLVVLAYSYFHNRLVKKMNEKLDELDLPEYHIKEDKEDYGHVAVVPLHKQTWTLEKIEDGIKEEPRK
jgi:PKD repeat protein